MRLIQGRDFEQIFQTFEHSAFHLEVEDAYHTPDESGPFQKFLSGKPDDLAWHQPWLDLIGQATATGRRVERIRIVSVPHGDYTRWGLTVAPSNIKAGEDIRWLPRQLLDGVEVTTDDFWLIDRQRVVFTVFTPDGTFAGGIGNRRSGDRRALQPGPRRSLENCCPTCRIRELLGRTHWRRPVPSTKRARPWVNAYAIFAVMPG